MNKTVVFTSAGEVELQDKEMPKPAAGEVLIETEVSLVSTGTELTFLSGECPGKFQMVRIYSLPYDKRLFKCWYCKRNRRRCF